MRLSRVCVYPGRRGCVKPGEYIGLWCTKIPRHVTYILICHRVPGNWSLIVHCTGIQCTTLYSVRRTLYAVHYKSCTARLYIGLYNHDVSKLNLHDCLSWIEFRSWFGLQVDFEVNCYNKRPYVVPMLIRIVPDNSPHPVTID